MISPALRHTRANSGLTFRPDANCVLWLPGQDDAWSAVIRDRSGKGNHGTLVGTTWARQSNGLWALSFDGNDYVNCGNAASLYPTNPTFECWVYVPSATQSGEDAIFGAAVGAGVGTAEPMLFEATSDLMGLQLVDTAAVTHSTFVARQMDAWVHLAATYNGTSQILYVNGVGQTPLAWTGTIKWGTSNFVIGCRQLAARDRFFVGKLALPRIYSRALSAPEILNHYNQERHLFNV